MKWHEGKNTYKIQKMNQMKCKLAREETKSVHTKIQKKKLKQDKYKTNTKEKNEV